MSNSKIVILICASLAVIALVAFLIWYFLIRKTDEEKKKVGDQKTFPPVSSKFESAAKEALKVNTDEKIKMMIAGLTVFNSLSDDDLKKTLNITDEAKVTEIIKNINTDKTAVPELLKLETVEQINAKVPNYKPVVFLTQVVNDEGTVDVSKKADTPFKEIIARITNEFDGYKDKAIATKSIQKYSANIIEIVVCNIASLYVQPDPTPAPQPNPNGNNTPVGATQSGAAAATQRTNTQPPTEQVGNAAQSSGQTGTAQQTPAAPSTPAPSTPAAPNAAQEQQQAASQSTSETIPQQSTPVTTEETTATVNASAPNASAADNTQQNTTAASTQAK